MTDKELKSNNVSKGCIWVASETLGSLGLLGSIDIIGRDVLVLIEAHLLVDLVQAAWVFYHWRDLVAFLHFLLQILLHLLLLLFLFVDYNLLFDISTDLINFVGERFRRAAYEATYWVNAIVIQQRYKHRLADVKPYFWREIGSRRPSFILLLPNFFKITNHVIYVLVTLLVVNVAFLPDQFDQLLNDKGSIQLRAGILDVGILIWNNTLVGNIESWSQVIDVFATSIVSLKSVNKWVGSLW